MITFACDHCGTHLGVKDELAGKQARCPGCGQVMPVPLPAVATASANVANKPETAALEAMPLQPTTAAGVAAAPPPDATVSHGPEPAIPADLVNHPRYEILQLLGQGGMGAVYKARHKVMNRPVALKVINAQFINNPRAVERFHREVQAAAKLDHPNIVRAYDADRAGDTHFLVMEFVEGTDLAKQVQAKGPLPVVQSCDYIWQAALGLQHAHEHSMVHRDIKPHNLMLLSGGVVKVMDFGLARLEREGASSEGLTGENVLMGTVDYIAPEQAKDAHRADIRADIYSLGCTLFHLLAGRPPYADGTAVQKIAGHLSGTPPLADLPATVPEALRAVLAKMLARDVAQRYPTPAAVADALLPFSKRTSGTQTAPPPVGPASRAGPVRLGSPDLPGAAGPVRLGSPDLRGAEATVTGTAAADSAHRPRRPRWVLLGVPVLVLLLFGLGTGWLLWSRNQPASEERPGPGPEEQPGANASGSLPPTFTNSLSMQFVLVPRGKFWMGGGGGKLGNKEVEIPHDFYLGTYEVTQGEWEEVMSRKPSYFSRAGAGKEMVKGISDADLKRFPVEMVSWEDAQEFLKLVNRRAPESGWVYRLPKEVEWEYACRGGPSSREVDYSFDFYLEKPSDVLLPGQANIAGDKDLKRTCKVGSYKPNRLGLYDMHGNVWEWCDDAEPAKEGASLRVVRSGGWRGGAGDCRAAHRSARAPSDRADDVGLRLGRVPVGKEPVAPKPPDQKAEALAPAYTNSLGMKFVLVPRGKFWMGGGGGKLGEKQVEIPYDFYLGTYEVTQGEWEEVMGSRPSHFSRTGGGKDLVKDIPDAELKRFPVEIVSWDEAQEFLKLLNRRAPERGWVYRLPKEAEWEYACRGGPSASEGDYSFDFYLEKPSAVLFPGQANVKGNGDLKRTCKVGSYKPNRLGLYDMHGNVWEWCDDAETAKDGASLRVYRGGSWGGEAGNCRAADHYAIAPSYRHNILGLRLARVPVGKGGK